MGFYAGMARVRCSLRGVLVEHSVSRLAIMNNE